MKLHRNQKDVADVVFVTGIGNQRQSGGISLRDYVQAVLLSDFDPAILSTVPSTAPGHVLVTADCLSSWIYSEMPS
jgi:hypothetical protein